MWQQGLGALLACCIAGWSTWLWQRDGRMLLLLLITLSCHQRDMDVIGGAEWRLTLSRMRFNCSGVLFVDRLARHAPEWRVSLQANQAAPSYAPGMTTSIWAVDVRDPYAVVREA